MKLELKHSLSVKLLRVVLLSALAVGVVLSLGQIVFDVYKTRHSITSDAQRILGMFRDPRLRRSTASTARWACRS